MRDKFLSIDVEIQVVPVFIVLQETTVSTKRHVSYAVDVLLAYRGRLLHLLDLELPVDELT